MKQPVLKRSRVVVSGSALPAGPNAERPAPAAEPGSDGEAKIRLRKNGEAVEAIEVDCPCGRSLEFQCLYETPDAAAPATGA